MAKYTYKLENDEYVFYEDGEVLKTPHNAVIKTSNEKLADLLLTNLEHFPNYTSPTSILTYHYTYCNLKADYTLEFIANDFSNCVGAESLMNDEYLMFRQTSPAWQPIAVYFDKELTEHFHAYNWYQLSAILVIYTAFHSWMLSHYIITYLLAPLYDGKDVDIDALKEEFLDDLEEYECERFGFDSEDEAYSRRRKEMSDTIETFALYFTLQK